MARARGAAGRRLAGRAGGDRGDAAVRGAGIRRGATGRRARWRPRAAPADATRDLRGARRRDQLLRHAGGGGDRAAAVEPASAPLEPDADGAGRVRRDAPACAARSSSRSSTCGRSRSASGSTSCAGCPTRRCCWRPSTRAAQGLYDRAINTAERTSARHDFGAALPDAVPRAVRRRGAGARGRRGAAVRHRAPGVALRRRTSCPPPARSG